MSLPATSPYRSDPSLSVSTLSPQIAQGIHDACLDYRQRTNASFVALLDPTGAVLLKGGVDLGLDLDGLSALAAASFGATQALVRHVGDPSFGGLCHQGRKHCLYVAPLTHDFMLLILFPAGMNPSEIRQSLVRIIPHVNQLLVKPDIGEGSSASRMPSGPAR